MSRSEASTESWIERGLQEIRSDRAGQLSFRTRRRLLLSLGPPHPEPLSPGHRVRAALAILVVREVLPVWAGRHRSRHPHDLIDGARRVLAGTGDVEAVRSAAHRFGASSMGGAPPEDRRALYVGHAAACAAFVAVDDEVLLPDAGVSDAELDSPEDPDLWDCAAWAAAAYAGDLPWTDARSAFDPERNRQLWTWYLTDGIAEARRQLER